MPDWLHQTTERPHTGQNIKNKVHSEQIFDVLEVCFMPGAIEQSVAHLTADLGVAKSNPSFAT